MHPTAHQNKHLPSRLLHYPLYLHHCCLALALLPLLQARGKTKTTTNNQAPSQQHTAPLLYLLSSLQLPSLARQSSLWVHSHRRTLGHRQQRSLRHRHHPRQLLRPPRQRVAFASWEQATRPKIYIDEDARHKIPPTVELA